jgi:hypothetical protein
MESEQHINLNPHYELHHGLQGYNPDLAKETPDTLE